METAWVARRASAEDLPGAMALMRRMLDEDFGHGWRADWHWDVADLDVLRVTYVEHPRQALFVALDGRDVVGTTAVREDGPKSPPHPEAVAARYAGPESGHLMRVWVAGEHRRRGIARALVELARDWAPTAGYRTLCLHTDARMPGAEPFWRALPTLEVCDARGTEREFQTIHFELPLSADASA